MYILHIAVRLFIYFHTGDTFSALSCQNWHSLLNTTALMVKKIVICTSYIVDVAYNTLKCFPCRQLTRFWNRAVVSFHKLQPNHLHELMSTSVCGSDSTCKSFYFSEFAPDCFFFLSLVSLFSFFLFHVLFLACPVFFLFSDIFIFFLLLPCIHSFILPVVPTVYRESLLCSPTVHGCCSLSTRALKAVT